MRGQRIGNYRLVSELGQGGMGTVYFAEHVHLHLRAAVKVLRAEVAESQEIVGRFFNEARAASEIRHPNIVQVSDFGCHEGHYYLMMELLEGETLGARIESQGTLTVEESAEIATQVSAALAAAHGHGVIHRDLKPENIFLTNQEDKKIAVKVLDFGIAKLVGSAWNKKGRTRHGVVMGTPEYMSPEQCRGDSVDHRTDVYALGGVIYEMLTGSPPFRGSLGALIAAHMSQPVIPPIERVPEIGEAMDELVLRALAKRPDERFATMRELSDALAKARRGGRSAAPQRRPEQTEQIANTMSDIVLERIESNRLVLPSIPHHALRCLELLETADARLSAVAEAASKDPLLAPLVVQLANSALFSRLQPVSTLIQAVSRVGVSELQKLLYRFAARRILESRNPHIRHAFQRIWSHSLVVAELSRELQGGADSGTVYLAGLLHDVGKPVVASLLLEAEKLMGNDRGVAWMDKKDWLTVIEATHRRVGVALAAKWALPAAVSAAIRDCADYDETQAEPATNYVCLANALAKQRGFFVGAVRPHEIFDELVRRGCELLEIDPERLASVTEHLSLMDASMPSTEGAPLRATVPAEGGRKARRRSSVSK